tara:strand:- start:1489 stop:1980 length:492 start_codon:yes stop_codon:yes gene_type:complete
MRHLLRPRRLAILSGLLLALSFIGLPPAAAVPPGTLTSASALSYPELVQSLNSAVRANKMGLVTRASATVGVGKALKQKIPGNMVVGVYRPDFAKRMLDASIPAGIEAPLRFYLTETANGASQLTYRQPSAVFAPYDDPTGQLAVLARELDALFAKIAAEAVR